MGASLPSTGRKSMPPASSQPDVIEVKLGMALSCAPASALMPAATTTMSAALYSKDVLNIAYSSFLRGSEVGRGGFHVSKNRLRFVPYEGRLRRHQHRSDPSLLAVPGLRPCATKAP